MGKENWLESLEAILVFVVPLLFVIPFYVLGVLTDISGAYIVYVIYIACSIVMTKIHGRTLTEMGLTRKEFLLSLELSGIPVVVPFLTRFIFNGLTLSPDVNSWAAVAQGSLYWAVSGLGQEILFRGMILFSFYRWKGGKAALPVSSVLFGLMHVRQGIAGVLSTILIGGYWGRVALKTKNIIGPTIAHFFFNFLFAFILAS